MSYPEIGSKYSGPPLDRPCLRQMPQEWQLEQVKDRWAGDNAVMCVTALAAIFAAVSVWFGWR